MQITYCDFWAGTVTDAGWRCLAIFGDQVARTRVRISLREERKRQDDRALKRLSHLLISAATDPLAYREHHKPLADIAGPVVRKADPSERLLDADGNISAPYRVQDTLRALFQNETITEQEFAAGRQFQDDFERSGLIGLKASDPGRVPISGGENGPELALDAGKEVTRALDRLGRASRASGAIWAILGHGMTMREYAARLSIAKHSKISEKAVQGILCAALSTLAAFYYPEPRPPRARPRPKREPAAVVELVRKRESCRKPKIEATEPMRKALKS